jgi:glycosyltransferase involved in cell wall biosynthesis
MNLALVTDVFPPNSGGSGWSTFYLARALQERGHRVQVVMPRETKESGTSFREYESLPVTEYHYQAARLPFVRNYTRNERLYPPFGDFLAGFFKEHRIELAHGQHYLTIPPTVRAAQQTGIPAVATVRDYWPVCYWTTHLSGDKVCPGCSEVNRLVCLYRNQGPAGIAAAPASLYMGANLRLKQSWLARADRTLAVSHYIAAKLKPFVPADRLEVLPNFVDLDRLEQITAQSPSTPETNEPYLLFVGKFEENKGARLLLEVLRQARPALPTVAVGDGSLRGELEQAAREGLNLRVLDWAANEEVLRLMKRAEALLFPSLWPEPLSRVLLEATGVGALVVAMETGGTPDIIQHDHNGLLASDTHEMAQHLQTILAPGQTDHRERLKTAARETARQHFSREAVVKRVEQLYLKLAGKA